MSDRYVCVACEGPYPCLTHPDAAAEPATGAADAGLVRLDRFLEQPDPEVVYRFADLWPADARVLLAAQYKAGKTTAVANLLRSLADLEPFLGTFAVAPPPGRVVLIDDELHENTLRRWLRQQRIENADRVDVLPLRGRLSAFDILTDSVRDGWARRIADAGATVVLLDCLRPLVDALGLSEDKDTGKLLGAFDELLTASGATEAAVVHHMGHHGERSRGDSRLRDWPDAEWRIVREDDEPTSPRYFAAYGRDVDVPEQRLELTGRRLAIVGGSRKASEAEDRIATLVDLVTATPGLNVRQLREGVPGRAEDVDRARIIALTRGLIVPRKEGRATCHYPNVSDVSDVSRTRDTVGEVNVSRVPIGHGHVTDPVAAAETDERVPDTKADPPPGFGSCDGCGRRTFGTLCRECERGAA